MRYKISFSVVSILFASSISSFGVEFDNWYNTSWGYRQKITISKSVTDAQLTNYPILVKISGTNEIFSKAKSDGSDIVFTNSTGQTKVSYEIERFSVSDKELIAWVKLSTLSSTVDTSLYVYYGNSSATSQPVGMERTRTEK